MGKKRKWRVKLTVETIVEAEIRAEAKAIAFNRIRDKRAITVETFLQNKENFPVLIDVRASAIKHTPDKIGGTD